MNNDDNSCLQILLIIDWIISIIWGLSADLSMPSGFWVLSIAACLISIFMDNVVFTCVATCVVGIAWLIVNDITIPKWLIVTGIVLFLCIVGFIIWVQYGDNDNDNDNDKKNKNKNKKK